LECLGSSSIDSKFLTDPEIFDATWEKAYEDDAAEYFYWHEYTFPMKEKLGQLLCCMRTFDDNETLQWNIHFDVGKWINQCKHKCWLVKIIFSKLPSDQSESILEFMGLKASMGHFVQDVKCHAKIIEKIVADGHHVPGNQHQLDEDMNTS
jgi:hypothetical protein